MDRRCARRSRSRTYAAAIRTDAATLASAAAPAGPDAPVPTCPEWVVRDLVQHLGGVHRWATSIVATPRTEPWNVDLPEVVGSWPDDDALTAGSRTAPTRSAAPRDGRPGPAVLDVPEGDVAARDVGPPQAHETAIHRVDGESALGASGTPFEPSFGADGIDELLVCFVPRRKTGLTSPEPRALRVTAVDADGDWDLVVDAERVTTLPGGTHRADATVRGEASDLYQALWNRPVSAPLDVTGDPALLALFLDKVHVTWA